MLYTKLLTPNTKNEISAQEKPYIKKHEIGLTAASVADFSNSAKQISYINQKCAQHIDYQTITPPLCNQLIIKALAYQ